MNASQTGYFAKLNPCNDNERNPGPSVHNIDAISNNQGAIQSV